MYGWDRSEQTNIIYDGVTGSFVLPFPVTPFAFLILILNDSCGSQAKMEHALGLSYVKP